MSVSGSDISIVENDFRHIDFRNMNIVFDDNQDLLDLSIHSENDLPTPQIELEPEALRQIDDCNLSDIQSVSKQTFNKKYPSSRWWLCTYFVKDDFDPLLDTEYELRRLHALFGATALEGQCERTKVQKNHLQFIVYFKKTVRRAHLVKRLPGIHVEPLRTKSGINYCRKDESRVSATYYTIG